MNEDENVEVGIPPKGTGIAPKEDVFVSKEEFDGLKDDMNKSFSQIIKMMEAKPEEKVQAKVEEKKVDEASADVSGQNPRYEQKVKEILGNKVERTYITYPKGGGTLFTIVIKNEFSNAPKDYLAMYKEDKRTINLEREEFRGEEGVEKYAKLVLANLNRTK